MYQMEIFFKIRFAVHACALKMFKIPKNAKFDPDFVSICFSCSVLFCCASLIPSDLSFKRKFL